MGKLFAALVAVAIGAGGALALVYFNLVPGLSRSGGSTSATSGTTGAAATTDAATTRVVALAKLEPAGGVIELGGTPGDRIEKLLVRPGQAVKQNDELIIFESRTLRTLEIGAATSQLDEASRRLKAEQAFADAAVRTAELAVESLVLDELELAAQQARLTALTKTADIARRDYERLSKLDAKITSAQEREHAGLLRDRAESELLAAGELIKKLEAGRDLKRREAAAALDQARAGRAKVDAAVPVESLEKAKAVAEERMRLAALRSPSDAVVLETLADEGDVVGQMPLLHVADLRSMVARAEVFETQVASVAVGQKAVITADALPGPITGKVERIGAVVGGNRLTSIDPRRTTDNRVVEVRILLDDPAQAARFVNMQVTATIETPRAATQGR
jgi:HlyD family secretion protein